MASVQVSPSLRPPGAQRELGAGLRLAALVDVDRAQVVERLPPLRLLAGGLGELEVAARQLVGLRPVPRPELQLRQVAVDVGERALVALLDRRRMRAVEPQPRPVEVVRVLEPHAERRGEPVVDPRQRRDPLELEGPIDDRLATGGRRGSGSPRSRRGR